MNSAMLNYDDFDLDIAAQDPLTLREAIKKSQEIRDSEPDTFVRIKSVGPEQFIVVSLSSREVYAEWLERMRQRLFRLSRKGVRR